MIDFKGFSAMFSNICIKSYRTRSGKPVQFRCRCDRFALTSQFAQSFLEPPFTRINPGVASAIGTIREIQHNYLSDKTKLTPYPPFLLGTEKIYSPSPSRGGVNREVLRFSIPHLHGYSIEPRFRNHCLRVKFEKKFKFSPQ